MVDKKLVLKEILSKEFKSFIYDKALDERDELLLNDPDHYDGEYNSNPYGVEPQLAGGSGCWEFSESGEDSAYDDCKVYVIEQVLNRDYKGLEDKFPYLYSFLDDFNNTDEEWLETILDYVLDEVK